MWAAADAADAGLWVLLLLGSALDGIALLAAAVETDAAADGLRLLPLPGLVGSPE